MRTLEDVETKHLLHLTQDATLSIRRFLALAHNERRIGEPSRILEKSNKSISKRFISRLGCHEGFGHLYFAGPIKEIRCIEVAINEVMSGHLYFNILAAQII